MSNKKFLDRIVENTKTWKANKQEVPARLSNIKLSAKEMMYVLLQGKESLLNVKSNHPRPSA